MKSFLVLALLGTSAPVAHDDAKRIFSTLAPSTVRLVDADGGKGSGTIIAVDGAMVDILTCRHVVEGYKLLEVDYDTDGAPMLAVPGFVVRVDPKHDLAIVRAPNPQNRPAVSIATIEPELYDLLYVIASPLGMMRQSATERLNTKDAGDGWSLSGMAIPGMSGSSMVNANGQIVCVLNAMASAGDEHFMQMAYCVPLGAIRSFLAPQPKPHLTH